MFQRSPVMQHKPSHSNFFLRAWHAFGYALRGLRAAWSAEFAFRVEVLACAVMLPLAFLLGRSPAEQLLLAGSCLAVLVCEMLNSAIEAAVDRIGNEHHPLAGQAKDMGAAAVLLSLIVAALCWGWILLDRFLL